MQPILPKKQMTEEDIKLQYITPAVVSKWSREKVTMETQITDGQINLKRKVLYLADRRNSDRHDCHAKGNQVHFQS